jgi:hypothetical protein
MDIIHIILDDDAVMTTQEEKTSRLSMCNSCEFLNVDVCVHCGCLVDVRAAYKEAHCPIGKWNGDTL